MAVAIPDLWQANEDANRLYSLYLYYLQMAGRHDRVVTVCHKIRHFASRGPGPAEGVFTFQIEIDSLCELKDFHKAWRRLRMLEEAVWGRRLNLRNYQWSISDATQLRYLYAPLLFFLGRYRQGCKLLETSLDFMFSGKRQNRFEILFDIYNDDDPPSVLPRVTLSHFYDQLGKDLSQWQHWNAFIGAFHPHLFRLAGVPQHELKHDSQQLPVFFAKLMQVRDERTTSGVTFGQSDLIDAAVTVTKRHKAVQREREDSIQRSSPSQERHRKKLAELFPEIRKWLKSQRD